MAVSFSDSQLTEWHLGARVAEPRGLTQWHLGASVAEPMSLTGRHLGTRAAEPMSLAERHLGTRVAELWSLSRCVYSLLPFSVRWLSSTLHCGHIFFESHCVSFFVSLLFHQDEPLLQISNQLQPLVKPISR